MLLRVRCKVGTWRVEGLTPQTTVGELKARVLAEHHVTPHPSQAFSLDPAGQRGMPEEATLEALGLRHGDLVHLAIREEDCAVEAGKKIAADGTIINKTHHEVASERGFRPGMRSLRSMKMHWTLTDFVELDSQVGGMERGKAGVSCCCCWPTPTPLRAHAPTFNRPSPDLTLKKSPHPTTTPFQTVRVQDQGAKGAVVHQGEHGGGLRERLPVLHAPAELRAVPHGLPVRERGREERGAWLAWEGGVV